MKEYTDLRIVFMGTPEFAVASLAALVKTGSNIVVVITVPDTPRQENSTPVKCSKKICS